MYSSPLTFYLPCTNSRPICVNMVQCFEETLTQIYTVINREMDICKVLSQQKFGTSDLRCPLKGEKCNNFNAKSKPDYKV